MKHHTLIHYRQQQGMTQVDLAKQIGVTNGVISRIERNIGNHSVRRILDWCRTQNIDPQEIFPPDAAA